MISNVRVARRTTREILDKALLLLMLFDRGMLEFAYHAGQAWSREEREESRNYFYDVVKKWSIPITVNERSIFEAELETLDKTTITATQWALESIPILLWAVGETSFPPYSGVPCKIDFHDYFATYGKDEFSLTGIPQDDMKIELYRQVAMLWHWRAVESRMGIFHSWNSFNRAIKKENAHNILLKTFGEKYREAIEQIPIAKKSPRDFLVNKKRYYELNKMMLAQMHLITKWRHHAFEWLCGDESWENTSADT